MIHERRKHTAPSAGAAINLLSLSLMIYFHMCRDAVLYTRKILMKLKENGSLKIVTF